MRFRPVAPLGRLAVSFVLTTFLFSCGGHSTPKPTPDFSLTASPGSLSFTAGTTSSAITITASSLSSFSGSVSVTMSGLPAGVSASPSTLTLSPTPTQSASATVTFTAPITTPSAAPTIIFTATSASLTHTAMLALTIQAAMTNAPDVTTWHYDLARTGLNPQETILTPANVNSTQFGKIGFFSVDGKVDAQPLFLANVVIANALH